MDQSIMQNGSLQINVTGGDNRPVQNADIEVSYTGEPGNVISQEKTNTSGRVLVEGLKAPAIELSLDETNIIQPYAEYTIKVTAEGFQTIDISGIQVFEDTLSVQNVKLVTTEYGNQGSNIVIPPHTLYGDFPEKIPESEIKPVNETGEIVLSRVVIPEYIVVHDGVPSDNTAKNYYVNYRDYIKNVASSEIYATWPRQTIIANVLAIMSFTLNRVYTEWYRNKGYEFTITSSTAFDHKWVYGRNIFASISNVVDDIFNQYLSRPNVKQPILTQYCDGKRVTCDGWLSQWDSKYLGDSGYSAIDILRNYYGDSIYINSAEQISGIPSSWPGYNLDIGSSGQKVRQLQQQLNSIAGVYSSIPKLLTDGIYGEETKRAVRAFQREFGLPATGITDFRTWYKISQIYVGISRIAENI